MRYLPNREVDVPAAPIDLVPLVIPQTEYLNRITGKVVVRVFIGPAGSVDQTEIVSSSPPGSYDAAAISAVTGTRFSPALVAGKPVGNVKLLVIDIDPYESGDEGKR